MEATFVVIGGGIAGVSCVETLAFLEPQQSIILISESSLIKSVTNLQVITRNITNFDVEEKNASYLTEVYPNVKIINDVLSQIDSLNSQILTNLNYVVKYKYLCLCTGGKPNILREDLPDYVLGIRDTDSVETFLKKLKHSKKIVVVGNGGIASEIIHKIDNTEVHWVIKDDHITSTFVEPGASQFFQESFHTTNKVEPSITKRLRYQEGHKSGAALGPDWYKNFEINGTHSNRSIIIHSKTEVQEITNDASREFPITCKLTSGESIECNFVVSATGVKPQINFQTVNNLLVLSSDGGISVNEHMETSVKNIYAAGDVCSPNWQFAKHWFPMKLWTQARQMGCYAAKCMSSALNGEEVLQDFCFELFTHATKLFGYKVILLGLYNGQKLGQNYEILLRTTKNVEYIKFILEDNKLQGALLIGETDLEETCENLILNQIDLSPYGDDILNPDIDIEDYFD